MSSIDPSKDPIHLGDVDTAIVQQDFGFAPEAFERYIDAYCQEDPGRLLMVETSPTSWPTWERHTLGVEIVFILEGRGEFIQQIDGAERRIPIEPGRAIINPTGVWHSADVIEPLKAIYITPCPGTEHKPRAV